MPEYQAAEQHQAGTSPELAILKHLRVDDNDPNACIEIITKAISMTANTPNWNANHERTSHAAKHGPGKNDLPVG